MQNTLQRQRGIATLLVAVMMLIILGLITLYTHRSVIIEQRSTSNEYKHALALEAAQSGVAQFMAQQLTAANLPTYFTAPVAPATTWTLNPALANTINTNGYLNSPGTFSHNFSNATPAASVNTLALAKREDGSDITGQVQTYQIFLAATATPSRFRLISRGCADQCNYAEAFVSTEMTIAIAPSCPLDINGNLNVMNGSSINGFSNNVPGFDCGVSVGSMSGTTGGVIGCKSNCGSDPYTPPVSQTGGTDKDAHFRRYFNASLADVMANPANCVVAGPVSINTFTLDPFFPSCPANSTVIINGALTINTALGPLYSGVINKRIIVNGDLTFNANSFNMQGFLYVLGNTTSPLAGTITILGGAAFAGDVNTNMGFNITADPAKSLVPGGGGVQVRLNSGSWRDF